jgi:adenine/guanine phosphoribosyltransferase-like PRPP-binding protein
MIYHSRGTETDAHDLHGYADEVKQTVKALRQREGDFDVIVVQGMSGVLMGGPVSLILDKPLCVVRKPDDDSHAGTEPINGVVCENSRCLFLDDFVSMGDTRLRCHDAVKEWGGDLTLTYEYAYDRWSDRSREAWRSTDEA